MSTQAQQQTPPVVTVTSDTLLDLAHRARRHTQRTQGELGHWPTVLRLTVSLLWLWSDPTQYQCDGWDLAFRAGDYSKAAAQDFSDYVLHHFPAAQATEDQHIRAMDSGSPLYTLDFVR